MDHLSKNLNKCLLFNQIDWFKTYLIKYDVTLTRDIIFNRFSLKRIVCLPGFPYRQIRYYHVVGNWDQLFMVGAIFAKYVKRDIKL